MSHTLVDLAETFVMHGGKHLFLDEIHKYPNWSREIKVIYDSFPMLKVTISGSSLLQILNPEADLSRRCLWYKIQGLSFREYLLFYYKIDLPIFDLEFILDNPDVVCSKVNAVCQPVKLFREYLQFGYFPFYFESSTKYYERIENITNYIMEAELPNLCGVDVGNVRKLKMLLAILSTIVPYEVDISRLATLMQASRNTVLAYLDYLSRAKLINLVYADLDSLKKLQKPDKIFLENTNLLYALSISDVQIGTVRETFVENQLMYNHRVEYGKKYGDFKVDGKWIFEVGGANKTFEQIANIPNSYILADDMEYSVRNKLPIWIVGLLY
jgi:predicted AAA+ superfamily ATPase